MIDPDLFLRFFKGRTLPWEPILCHKQQMRHVELRPIISQNNWTNLQEILIIGREMDADN